MQLIVHMSKAMTSLPFTQPGTILYDPYEPDSENKHQRIA